MCLKYPFLTGLDRAKSGRLENPTEEIIPVAEVVNDNGLKGRLAVEYREVGGSNT